MNFPFSGINIYILGHQTQVFWLFYTIFGPLVNTSKENFETLTRAQHLIDETHGGKAGLHLRVTAIWRTQASGTISYKDHPLTSYWQAGNVLYTRLTHRRHKQIFKTWLFFNDLAFKNLKVKKFLIFIVISIQFRILQQQNKILFVFGIDFLSWILHFGCKKVKIKERKNEQKSSFWAKLMHCTTNESNRV